MTDTKNINHLYFFTATILNGHHLFEKDKYKDIIVNSLKYLVNKNKIKLSAFVIMPNHIHLVWKTNNKLKLSNVQRDFLKFTAQKIKNDLLKNNKNVLKKYYVGLRDREYQFWQRNPLSIELITEKVARQKIDYIHYNPVIEKWKLCRIPQEYKYSSAQFYYEGIDNWGFLTHYNQVYL